jgi:replicative DNA helicase
MAKDKPKKLIEEKILPQSPETEESILGAALLEQDSFFTISSILKVSHFYKEENSLIYKAMLDLSKKNEPIDVLTVCQQLKINNALEAVGGGYAVSKLTDKTSTSANIEAHSRIVIQKAMLREVIIIARNAIEKAYDERSDCFDVIEYLGNKVSNIFNGIENNIAQRIDVIRDEVIQDCKDEMINPTESGVPISIEKMQNHLNGWRKGNLIILAARPGMGKTAVALDYAIYPALKKIPVAIFSMEMTRKELAGRLMSKYSYISSQKINNNTLDTFELSSVIKESDILNKIPLYIDDTSSLSITRLRSKAYRLKQLYGIQLMVIDYLQLMEGVDESSFNRENEIAQISRGLKKLARELEIPIIALSQLSRQVENRPGANKRPQLSDLRDSGAIEQDADMVIFLHRPEYYGINNYTHGTEEMNNTKGLLIQIIAKYRAGGIADIRTKWHGSTTSISDWDVSVKQPQLFLDAPLKNFYEPAEKTVEENPDDLPF